MLGARITWSTTSIGNRSGMSHKFRLGRRICEGGSELLCGLGRVCGQQHMVVRETGVQLDLLGSGSKAEQSGEQLSNLFDLGRGVRAFNLLLQTFHGRLEVLLGHRSDEFVALGGELKAVTHCCIDRVTGRRCCNGFRQGRVEQRDNRLVLLEDRPGDIQLALLEWVIHHRKNNVAVVG